MSHTGKKILIVEDDDSIRKVFKDRLSQEGFSIIEAENGEKGLEVALKEHPDLILLDILMPKMDGMTMLSKLHEDEWGKAVDVLILTNVSEKSKIAESLDKGVFDYIIKSEWGLEDIIKKVKERF